MIRHFKVNVRDVDFSFEDIKNPTENSEFILTKQLGLGNSGKIFFLE